MSDQLSDAMGLVPLTPEIVDVPAETKPEEENTDGQVQSDFDDAREKLLEVVSVGQEALKDLAEFARSAPSARVFEVLTQLLSTQSDNATKIMDLHKKKKDATGTAGPQKVTNQLVVTTADLLKMIGNKDNRA